MSTLSNVFIGKTLSFWNEKLKENPNRNKFLITKLFEILTFKGNCGNISCINEYIEFPEPIKNNVTGDTKLCIVIPTFIKSDKDKQDLSNLLQSIKNLSLKPHKVIVIDDCSPVNFSFPETVLVHSLRQNSGPAKARNIGKRLAIENEADIIAFTDTDCILSENWNSIIIKSFLENNNFQILSGDTPAYDQSWFGTYHNINGTLNGRKFKNTERLLYGTTANLAITRKVAEHIDFNENFPIAAGEDIEFCFKANKKGYAIKYIPTMTVFHNFGYNGQLFKNLKRFRQQFKKYGQGEKILLKEIPNYYAYFDRTEEITTQNGL